MNTSHLMEEMALWRSCIVIGMLPAACCLLLSLSGGHLGTKPRTSKHSPIAIGWLEDSVGGAVQHTRARLTLLDVGRCGYVRFHIINVFHKRSAHPKIHQKIRRLSQQLQSRNI